MCIRDSRTGKVCWPETDVLPLCHATNLHRLTANCEIGYAQYFSRCSTLLSGSQNDAAALLISQSCSGPEELLGCNLEWQIKEAIRGADGRSVSNSHVVRRDPIRNRCLLYTSDAARRSYACRSRWSPSSSTF